MRGFGVFRRCAGASSFVLKLRREGMMSARLGSTRRRRHRRLSLFRHSFLLLNQNLTVVPVFSPTAPFDPDVHCSVIICSGWLAGRPAGRFVGRSASADRSGSSCDINVDPCLLARLKLFLAGRSSYSNFHGSSVVAVDVVDVAVVAVAACRQMQT